MFPLRVLLTVLAIVFLAEVGVMFVLPALVPESTDPRLEALADSCLLTLISAPLIWWAIIRPLRRVALCERARAESIVAAAAEGIVTIDQSGTIQSFNRAAEQILGYSSEEIVGANVSDLMPERFVGRHKQALRRLVETGRSSLIGETVDLPGRRKDGTEVPLALSVSEAWVDGRRLFTGILRDLTEWRRIEAERAARARQQAVVAELGRFALAGDDLGELFDEATRATAKTLGVPYCLVAELTMDETTLLLRAGKGWARAVVGEATIPVQNVMGPANEPLDERPLRVDELAPDDDRRRAALFADHNVTSGVSVVIGGGERPFGILGVYDDRPRDFSEDEVHFLQDVAIKLTLAIQRKDAERRRGERDKLRAEQMAALAQLATGVAHEIRNPLTSIKMMVQALSEDGGQGSLAGEDLHVVVGEIRRMERCLNSFLDFAHPAKPDCRLLDLTTLIKRTFALVEARGRGQGVALLLKAPDPPALVEADWEQLQQLLFNLVLNALDAMPRGGQLVAEVVPTSREVELRLLDSGPGIPDDLLGRLFEPFVTSKRTGVGLGLVISRRIAEDHGGSLVAGNRPEGGACFVLRLAAAQSTSGRAAPRRDRSGRPLSTDGSAP